MRRSDIVASSCSLLLACGSPEGGSGATTTGVTTAPPLTTTGTTAEPTTTGTSATPTTGTVTGPEVTTTTSSTGTSAETTTTSGVATDSTSETSAGETEPPPPCSQGEIVCEGAEAKVCDGMGGYASSEVCVGFCQPGVGCVACEPNAPYCEGDVAMQCAPDGLGGEKVEDCDAVQGLFCDPELGRCDGPCANPAKGAVGCDFYPTITLQHEDYNGGTKVFAAVVANTSAAEATITVTRGAMMVKEVTVPGGAAAAIPLPWIAALTEGTGPSAVTPAGAYRLRSDQPVTVYQYNLLYKDASNDASLLLPASAWTGDYVVASFPHFGHPDPELDLDYPGFYAVVARLDATTVTLTPSATGSKVQAGAGVAADGTGVVVLNAGDVLQVVSAPGGDLTGTAVSADKPVQVLGGHKCTNVPASVDGCDHLEEAMFPRETLAQEYVVTAPGRAPNGSPDHGQIVRFIAVEPNTTLTFVPDQPVVKVLAAAGDFVELGPTVARFKVSADRRFLVSQYMVGQEGGYGEADPSMRLAVATEQYRKDHVVHAPPTWASNFVDIVLKTGSTVTVDGAPVGAPVQIGVTGYSLARVKLGDGPLGDGRHTIVGSDGVGVSVYGLEDSGSYWVVGGLDLDHL